MNREDLDRIQEGVVKTQRPEVENRNKLTRHQRTTLYFKALRLIDQLFRDVGFHPMTDPGHGYFVQQLGSFVLEMKVEAPSNIRMAHVTSFPGYCYSSEKINAKVTFMSPSDSNEYLIRVTGVLTDKGVSRGTLPIYVTMDPKSPDPLREAFKNALGAAHSLIAQDPKTLEKIKEALKSRDINADFDRLKLLDS